MNEDEEGELMAQSVSIDKNGGVKNINLCSYSENFKSIFKLQCCFC